MKIQDRIRQARVKILLTAAMSSVLLGCAPKTSEKDDSCVIYGTEIKLTSEEIKILKIYKGHLSMHNGKIYNMTDDDLSFLERIRQGEDVRHELEMAKQQHVDEYFLCAAKEGKIDDIKKAIKEGANINIKDYRTGKNAAMLILDEAREFGMYDTQTERNNKVNNAAKIINYLIDNGLVISDTDKGRSDLLSYMEESAKLYHRYGIYSPNFNTLLKRVLKANGYDSDLAIKKMNQQFSETPYKKGKCITY